MLKYGTHFHSIFKNKSNIVLHIVASENKLDCYCLQATMFCLFSVLSLERKTKIYLVHKTKLLNDSNKIESRKQNYNYKK